MGFTQALLGTSNGTNPWPYINIPVSKNWGGGEHTLRHTLSDQNCPLRNLKMLNLGIWPWIEEKKNHPSPKIG